MTYKWKSCPDCMRSDGHHPLCPSEHLILEGEIEIDDMDAFREERDRRERDREFEN